MQLKVLGTGSNGNCYALIDNLGQILLLDVGIPISKIKIGINFKVSNIAGAIITHSHTDHSLSSKDLKRMGIHVFEPCSERDSVNFNCIGVCEPHYKVTSFALTDLKGNFVHTNSDSTPCPIYGFLIEHKECGKILYVTDCVLIKYRFNNLNHIILGVDYDTEEFDSDGAKKTHILGGHMNLDTAKGFISTSNSSALQNVILCHLSTTNSSPSKFKEQISAIVDCPVHIACKGLKIQL